MKFKIRKNLIKKYYPLFYSLFLGLLFFNIMFTLIRRYYYGEIPLLPEYIFPFIMGVLFGGGIGLWQIQNREYKIEIGKTLNDLKKSNELLVRSNKELSQTRQKLTQSQKMELIGVIAGSVVHDLNNVLAASINYPEILLLKYSKNRKLCEYLEIIKKSGLKAAAMVEDLLNLARRGVSVEEVISLNSIIEECIKGPEFEKISAYHENVELNLDLDESLNNIIGSPLHIMKAVINLISNAAEAMPDGGRLTIKSYNCTLERLIKGYEDIPCGNYSVICVKDTGAGISDEDLEKIFEPFFTKKVMGRSGTGLGMAVIWGTVKDHNGKIDVKSIEGKGTAFFLYFPATEKQLDAGELINNHLENVTEYKGNGELILVVDDIKDQRDIAEYMLSTLGYSVDTVSNGKDAVEYIKNKTPDLVLLDMIMSPGIDGLDTYKKMLKYNPHQKSLITSGYRENKRVKKLLELGAGKYIKKPYTLARLGNSIKDELNKGSG